MLLSKYHNRFGTSFSTTLCFRKRAVVSFSLDSENLDELLRDIRKELVVAQRDVNATFCADYLAVSLTSKVLFSKRRRRRKRSYIPYLLLPSKLPEIRVKVRG